MLSRLLALILAAAAGFTAATGSGVAYAQAHETPLLSEAVDVRRALTGDPEPLLAIDTLLSVENRGLTRLFVALNDYRFKLATDADEVAQSGNAFLVPREGLITIDIADLLAPDDANPFDDVCSGPVPNGNNCVAFTPQGPEGADAQVIISDTPLLGQPIAYAIQAETLKPLPEAFERLQGYPNPSTSAVTLTYAIPESRTNGLPVSLVIYDVLGRCVRTLVQTRQFPGTFRVRWDGADGNGRPVASGLYLARIESDGLSQTVRLTLLR